MPGDLHVVEPVTAVYARQARQLTYEISGAGLRALPPAPPIRSNLGLVKGADVLLLFLESYGAVSWDRPALVEALAASRARLDTDIRDTGRRVVSALVESTTFGGKSWLAHISLLSGTEVRDEHTNVRLMAQRRETMVSAFSRQGYRTVAIMPGVRAAWPEGAFYGFDEIYDRRPPRLSGAVIRVVGHYRSVRARSDGRPRDCATRPPAGVRLLPHDQHAHAVHTGPAVPAGLEPNPHTRPV